MQKHSARTIEHITLPQVNKWNVTEFSASDLDIDDQPDQCIFGDDDAPENFCGYPKEQGNIADSELMDKLLLVQRKLSQSKQRHSVFSEILQINVLKRILLVVQDLINNPQAAPIRYVATLVGASDGFKYQPTRQCIYPLIWGNISNEFEIEYKTVNTPSLMLDVRALQRIFLEYYSETVGPLWPDLDRNKGKLSSSLRIS
ncbi:unnamed protein product [Echinostoma caproni]|uniref:Uncharacterized protein n=1 Tax=Echinostoma caproni TaxID=27848 RepID=A0A183ABU1_9TREM|nr:unnamed protein product [Echinostoma caproni]